MKTETEKKSKPMPKARNRPLHANPDGLIFGREITQKSWNRFTAAYRAYYAKQDAEKARAQ